MQKQSKVKFICGCIVKCFCNGVWVVLSMVVATSLLDGTCNDALVETAVLGHCLMKRCITQEELVQTSKFVVQL